MGIHITDSLIQFSPLFLLSFSLSVLNSVLQVNSQGPWSKLRAIFCPPPKKAKELSINVLNAQGLPRGLGSKTVA